MDSTKPNRHLNRLERRRQAKLARKDPRMKRLNLNLPSMARPENSRELVAQLMPLLVATMAELGPPVRRELESNVGDKPTAGHVVDLLMTVAARMEESIEAVDAASFYTHASTILILARDLAYMQGKIKPKPEGAPS
jgi:hypothetical protein